MKRPREPNKKVAKMIDASVEEIYRRTCSGVTIDIFDIPKVFAAGRAAYDLTAATDPASWAAMLERVEAAIVAKVAEVRRN